MISNTVETSSAILDYDTSNNSATVSNTIAEDLSVETGASDIGQVTEGSQVTYLVCVDNHSATAASYTATTTLPANTTFVSATGNFTLTGNILTWHGTRLDPGECESLRFVVQATATGIERLTATVTGLVPDTTPLDNTSSVNPAPAANLVSYWKADGNANDAVGTNSGTLQNGATFAPGYAGLTFNLDGVNDYVSIPDSTSLDSPSLTFSTRFMTTSFISTSVIAAKPQGSGNNDTFALWFDAGQIHAGVGVTSQQFGSIDVGFTPTANVWYQATMTFDNSTKLLTLYLNGNAIGSRTLAANFTVGYDSHPLLLGADINSGAIGFYWRGKIDEVYSYNRALAASEVQSIDYSHTLGIVNQAPTISAATNLIVVNEGQVASNLGVLNDPDGENRCVLVSASTGTVTQDPVNAGNWTWTWNTTDGPVQSQTVTVTVNDGHGGIVSTAFQLVVNNVAPTATLSNGGNVDEGSEGLVSFVNQFDPSGPDTSAGFLYRYDFDSDGVFESISSSSPTAVVPSIYLVDDGMAAITGRIYDKDGGYNQYVTTIMIANVAPTVNAGADHAVNEGDLVSFDGTFFDPGTADTHVRNWHVVASNGQLIADGSGALFSFTPDVNGI